VMSLPSESGRTGGMRLCRCQHIFFEHGPRGCTRCDCVDVRGGLLPGSASGKAMIALLQGECCINDDCMESSPD
jgi:hypothetical protein